MQTQIGRPVQSEMHRTTLILALYMNGNLGSSIKEYFPTSILNRCMVPTGFLEQVSGCNVLQYASQHNILRLACRGASSACTGWTGACPAEQHDTYAPLCSDSIR
jgi:hypothetical protein